MSPVLLPIFFANLCFATPLVLYKERSKKTVVAFKNHEGLRISECENTTCTAAKVGKRKIVLSAEQANRAIKSGYIHPAVSFCNAAGGTAQTFYNTRLDEVSVCKFSDGSIVISDDLLPSGKAS